MKRLLPVLLLSIVLLVGWTTPCAAANDKRPNILVFLVDDMGLMDTSVPMLSDGDGKPERHPLNDFYRTPNMEQLASQGLRFSNFYAMSVCSPTRVSLMTGQTSARHHTTQWINSESNNMGPFGSPDWQWKGITAEQTTLASLLQQNGYRTIHCGKAHFGPIGSYGEFPDHFGFDVNIAGCSYGQPGSYYGKDNFGHGMKGRERRAVPGLDKYHGREIYLTEALTLEVNAAIEDAVKADKPFFAYMAHYAVHAPFDADPRFVGNYPDRKKNVAAFASMIEGMDKSLGDILDHLRKLGVAENTLVFFLGDNGTDAPLGPIHDIACAAPLRGKKGTHYEGGMRAPLIAAWAQPAADNALQEATPIAAGEIRDNLTAVYDLMPTILAVAGIPHAPAADGVDLRPSLSGKQVAGERDFLMHFPHQHRSSYFTVFRRGPWKLIYHYRENSHTGQDRIQLFHLARDRDESHNLAATESVKLQEMFAAMQTALTDAGAQFPLDDDKKQRLKPVLP